MGIGVDKDCAHGRVYWSDISLKCILSTKYDGTDRQVFIDQGKQKQYYSKQESVNNKKY